jgi:A/G-specific adenine glycosylase
MLQQTQVKTVIPYFLRFIARFPDVNTLANAEEDDILAHWSGLGYYRRARYLHQAARLIMTHHNGLFPHDLNALMSLPGVGASTASAIASQAFNQPTAILDGNVKRVLSRYFLVDTQTKKAEQQLWQHAQQCMSKTRCADYTQAIMDLGATQCTAKQPACEHCPVQTTCLARRHHVVMEYPAKPKKKTLPTKEAQFLLLHTQDGAIYLEKRPKEGIWGGLWSLPSFSMDECLKTHVFNTHHVHVEHVCQLPFIKHTFSHFHLHLHTISIELPFTLKDIEASAQQNRWFKPDELNAIGLAKPISVLLQHFLSMDVARVIDEYA